MPNAPLSYVTGAALKSSSGDAIVIVGGTNDILNDDLTYIYQTWESDIIELSKRKPVIIATIPDRLERYLKNDDVHFKLLQVNNYIRELSVRIKDVFLVDLGNLQSFHYKGLHLNRKAKTRLAVQTITILNDKFHVDKGFNKPQIITGKEHHTSLSTSTNLHSLSVFPCLEINNKDISFPPVQAQFGSVKLIDADMADIIENYKDCNKVAFAHCISSDLRMSAGVAVVFKNKFGRPLLSNCIDTHLTRQKINLGATVYGLITKMKYSDKPATEDYDKAFNKLTIDFKANKLTELICSPMGCVRDRIPLEYFASKIKEFCNNTKASVTIVAADEKHFHSLRNGLTFSEFMDKLRSALEMSFISQPTTLEVTNNTVGNRIASGICVKATTDEIKTTTDVMLAMTSAAAGGASGSGGVSVDMVSCVSVSEVVPEALPVDGSGDMVGSVLDDGSKIEIAPTNNSFLELIQNVTILV
uniref:Uncharacterized protein n=1 Tax=Graphocephala atropunctata TaxID=36148 RepID=A0A1B6MK86_9HEMI